MTELFRLETERLLLVWGAPSPPEEVGGKPFAGLRAQRVGPRFDDRLPDGPIRLREQTEYSLLIRSAAGEPVIVEHRDPVLLRGLHAAQGGAIVYGRINFGSQVGRSALTVRVGGQVALELELEVFPTKLDYAEDYPRLVADTQQILTGLVLEHLRATVQPGAPVPVARPTRLEWLALLEHVAARLERAVTQIARDPLRALRRDPQDTRVERVGRPDAALRRAVARGAGRGPLLPLGEGLHTRTWLPERRARPTLDTPEHRWLAAQLRRVHRSLARLRAEQGERGGGERHQVALARLEALQARVARLLRAPPIAAATAPPPPGFASMQLLGAPGYADAYRACLALLRGVRLRGGPVALSVKELHLLYEYWCFLTLVRLLAELLGVALPAAQMLATEERGLRVLLQSGQQSEVVLQAPDGRRASVIYNPRFGDDPLLVPQRPDLLLTLHHPGRPPRVAVLDAKYRVDHSPEYRRRYGSAGPPEDALNTLHRYRDALVRPEPGAEPVRLATRAVALFPLHEEAPGAFRASRLWQSLERLGVGAIPLLPGDTGYLEEWLRSML